MKVVPYPCIIQLGNEELKQAQTNGAKRVKFCHYTSLETLKIIIEEKTIKLNRIDLVNDLTEKSYLGEPEIYSQVFTGCFSHRLTESIPQWYMYTPINRGVRIVFTLNEELGDDCTGLIDINKPILIKSSDMRIDKYSFGYNLSSNMCSSPSSKWNLILSTTDVIYSDELMTVNPIKNTFDSEVKVDISPMAKIKQVEWNFEEETRIIGMFRTVYEGIEFDVPEHILLPLDFNKFAIEIILNPWCTSEFKNEVQSLCRNSLSEYSYTIKESTLHGSLAPRKW